MSGFVRICVLASLFFSQDANAQDIFAPPIREMPERIVRVDRLGIAASVDSSARLVTVSMEALVRANRPGVLQFAWPTRGIVFDSVRVGLAPGDTAITVVRADSLILTFSSPLSTREPARVSIHYRLPLGDHIKASTDPRSPDACCLWTTSNWLPLPDDPAHRYPASLAVRVPTAWSVVAGGSRSRSENLWTFKLPRPARFQDLGFAAGVFEMTTAGQVELAVPKGALGDRQRFGERIQKPLRYFTTITGYRLPWDTVRVALLPFRTENGTASAGMIRADARGLVTRRSEYSSDLFAGPRALDLATLVAQQWTQGVLSPEWWSEGWVNDAIAGVMALAFIEDEAGAGPLARARHQSLLNYLDEASLYRRPLVWDRFHDPGELRDQHAQGKGSLLLFQIKDRMGDTAFWASIRRLFARRAFRPLNSDHLADAFRSSAASWIDGFFDSWVYSAGHPVVRFTSKFDAPTERIIASLQQVQEGALVPAAFPLDTRIEWLLLGGIGHASLSSTEGDVQFEAPAVMSPRFVRMDPDGLLVAEIETGSSLPELAALLRYGPPYSRLVAARRIPQFVSDPTAMLSLRLAYFTETLPTIRAEILRAAGMLTASDSGTNLLTAGLSDQEASVRLEAVRALSRLSPRGGADAILEGVAQRDTMYHVQAAAVLGMSGDGAEGLARAALITSSEDAAILQAGAAVLVRNGADGRDAFLRHSAPEGPVARILAALELAPVVEPDRQTRLRVLALLAHPNVSVRLAGARAGHALLRRGNRPAIERLLTREWHPEVAQELEELSAKLESARW